MALLVDFDLGLCSALKKGLIQSSGSVREVNNLSIIFCLPFRTETFIDNVLFLEEKVKYDLLTEADLLKFATQKNCHPTNFWDLTKKLKTLKLCYESCL